MGRATRRPSVDDDHGVNDTKKDFGHGLLAVWPHYRWVAAAQVPYFVWVSIATVLQLSITWMNRS